MPNVASAQDAGSEAEGATGDDGASARGVDGDGADDSSPGSGATPVAGGGGTSSPPPCTEARRNDRSTWWTSYDVSDVQLSPYDENRLLRSYPAGPDDDTRYTLAVDRDCDRQPRTPVRWVPEPEDGAADVEAVLAARGEALARVRPEPPTPSLAPPNGAVLAGLPAWLWVDSAWEAETAQATTPGGLTVTVGVEPQELIWTTPVGEHRCAGPGVPWTEQAMATYRAQPDGQRGTGHPECAQVFTDVTDGTVATEVAVRYRVWWTQGGGMALPLPDLTLTGELPLTVGERRAVRVR